MQVALSLEVHSSFQPRSLWFQLTSPWTLPPGTSWIHDIQKHHPSSFNFSRTVLVLKKIGKHPKHWVSGLHFWSSNPSILQIKTSHASKTSTHLVLPTEFMCSCRFDFPQFREFATKNSECYWLWTGCDKKCCSSLTLRNAKLKLQVSKYLTGWSWIYCQSIPAEFSKRFSKGSGNISNRLWGLRKFFPSDRRLPVLQAWWKVRYDPDGSSSMN